jgi:hypothetical protein
MVFVSGKTGTGSTDQGIAKSWPVCRRGKIVIENREGSQKVSMKDRVQTGMPTTTNLLEPSHEHLNATTPRRNTFWQSLHRIVGMILAKSTCFWSCVQHNFRDEGRDSFTRAEKLDITLMQREENWYHSTPAACTCGETVHLLVMHGLSMPCSHQYSLGVEKPSVPHQYNL